MMVADVPVIKLGQRIVEAQKHSTQTVSTLKQLQSARISGYFQLKSYTAMFFVMYVGILIKIGTKVGFFKRLLLKYPDFFTFGVFKAKGPTSKQLEESSFETVFVAKGYKEETTYSNPPDYEIVSIVEGPEMGYVSMIFLISDANLCSTSSENAFTK